MEQVHQLALLERAPAGASKHPFTYIFMTPLRNLFAHCPNIPTAFAFWI